MIEKIKQLHLNDFTFFSVPFIHEKLSICSKNFAFIHLTFNFPLRHIAFILKTSAFPQATLCLRRKFWNIALYHFHFIRSQKFLRGTHAFCKKTQKLWNIVFPPTSYYLHHRFLKQNTKLSWRNAFTFLRVNPFFLSSNFFPFILTILTNIDVGYVCFCTLEFPS